MTQHLPYTTRLWSLAEDALVEGDAGSGPLTVVTRWGEFVFPDAGELVRESMRRMSLGPVALDNVRPEAVPGGGERAGLRKVLDRLSGSVVHSLRLDDRQGSLISAVPTAPVAPFTVHSPPRSQRLRLSRFAMLRTQDGVLLLESPRARFQVVLHQQLAVQIATGLAAAGTIGTLATTLGLPEQLVAELAGFLVGSGVVLAAADSGGFAEDTDPNLRPWTHHELQFHQQSRSRHAAAETMEPPAMAPAVRPRPPGPVIKLDTPVVTRDAALTELLESDHFCPDFSTKDFTVEQLGELLYRSARVRGPGPPHLPHGMSHEASQRPYFSIACLYELEVYLTVERCAGLDRGAYHYDPDGHALTLVTDAEPDLAAQLDTAMIAAGCMLRPSAMLTVAARMDRTAVLGGAAYATTLMHVGALQQTVSLVATAMGLDAHAIPADGNDSVERAIGLRWPAEVVVGLCVLNRPL